MCGRGWASSDCCFDGVCDRGSGGLSLDRFVGGGDGSLGGAATSAVDFQTVDCPVGVGEGGWIVLHIGLAGRRFG